MRILLFVIMASISLAALEKAEVKVLAFSFPPLAIAGDPPSGLSVEYVEAALKEIGKRPKFVFLPAPRALEAFNNGEGLLLTTHGLIKEDQALRIKLAKLKAGFFGLKNNEKKTKTVSYKRGIERAEELIKEMGLEAFPVADYQAGIKTLLRGRAERFLAMDLTLNYVLKNSFPEEADKIDMLEGPFYEDEVGLLAPKKDKKLFEALRKVMHEPKMKSFYMEKSKEHILPFSEKNSIKDHIREDFENRIRKGE